MTDPIREALEKRGLLTWVLRATADHALSKGEVMMALKDVFRDWHKEAKEKTWG